jgi:type I restriction enzyme S subunit
MAADPYITVFRQTLSDFGFSQSKLWPADTLCITIAGANTAKTAILKFDACFPDSVVGFRADPDKCDLHFVKYSLDLMKDKFLAVTRGATQDNLSLDKLLSFPLFVPSVDVQKKIGRLLAAHDDLIDINNRRMLILEEMARRLFEERFVKPLGRLPLPSDRLGDWELPMSWKFVRLADVATIVMGQSPPSWAYNLQGEGLPLHQGVTDFDAYFHTNRVFVKNVRNPRIAEAGDILFSVRAPVARMALALDQMVLGRGLSAVRPNAFRDYILCHLRATFPRPDMFGDGAIYKAVNKDDVRTIPIVWPASGLIEKFEQTAEPMWSAIRTLYLINCRLRAARDLLFPKLVSGEIDLRQRERDADGMIERVAAA